MPLHPDRVRRHEAREPISRRPGPVSRGISDAGHAVPPGRVLHRGGRGSLRAAHPGIGWCYERESTAHGHVETFGERAGHQHLVRRSGLFPLDSARCEQSQDPLLGFDQSGSAETPQVGTRRHRIDDGVPLLAGFESEVCGRDEWGREPVFGELGIWIEQIPDLPGARRHRLRVIHPRSRGALRQLRKRVPLTGYGRCGDYGLGSLGYRSERLLARCRSRVRKRDEADEPRHGQRDQHSREYGTQQMTSSIACGEPQHRPPGAHAGCPVSAPGSILGAACLSNCAGSDGPVSPDTFPSRR